MQPHRDDSSARLLEKMEARLERSFQTEGALQEHWKTRGYRLENASVLEYNRIALRVMKELEVPVNDLPAALGDAADQARLHDSGGIHFTKEGSQKLAAAVAVFVTRYLPVKQ